MREIKFRVRCEHLKKYIYDYLTGTSVSLNDLFKNGSIINGKNTLVFEQYTGLKDCNDVDVYEGDIIKDRYEEIFEVQYCNENCAFGSLLYAHKEFYLLKDFEGIEVIGNIHENPELLGVTGTGIQSTQTIIKV